LLSGQGFREVYNLSGGIRAWNGEVSVGPVELNMDLITGTESAEDIVKIAYCMEHTLGGFYTTLQSRAGNSAVAQLMGNLAAIEDKHKQYLLDVYRVVNPEGRAGEDMDASCDGIMEGGFEVEQFIEQNEHLTKTPSDLLELSMMLEAQAMDLYLRFAMKTEKEGAKELLFKIADEEKAHLRALGRLRDDVA